ncbi:MAG: hypothetical protein M3Q32_07230 [Pseudomonadota bacterium]|nr:hypothetical protein [Pseudomonadota bacterium]
MKWLLAREMVVGLAVLGAVLSLLASILQSKRKVSEETAKRINLTGYFLMGISIVLFIVSGLVSSAT